MFYQNKTYFVFEYIVFRVKKHIIDNEVFLGKIPNSKNNHFTNKDTISIRMNNPIFSYLLLIPYLMLRVEKEYYFNVSNRCQPKIWVLPRNCECPLRNDTAHAN